MSLLQTAFADHQRVIAELQAQAPLIERLAETLIACLRGGGKVCWCGNGGSAADAQHLAAELVGRFRRERRGLPSIALTTDSSILTAVANDYGYDRIFSRQVEALCRPGDVLVGITTSGNSPNILAAVAEARRLGVRTIGLTGRDGGQLKQAADLCLVVNHPETARIQEAHILVGHILCDLTEAALL